MAARQIEHLIKMANQIALNMAACGDEGEAASKTGEHMQKFWTPAMCRQLIRHSQEGGVGLSPLVVSALGSMESTLRTQEDS